MNYTNILVQCEAGIATVTVNRPKVMNALNHVTLTELKHAFLALDADAAVRLIVVTGAPIEGKPAEKQAFIAGADIGELHAMQTAMDDLVLNLQRYAPEGIHWTYTPRPAESHATIYHGAALEAYRTLFATPAASAP